MKNILTSLIIGFIVALWFFYFYNQKSNLKNVFPTKNISQVVKTDPTTIPPSDEELIKKALADKYQKDLSEVDFTISKNEGSHASGGVKFAGEIAGAWVLAAKTNDQWIIVQDGNGTVSCETIAPYNFPSSIVSECVDKDGNLNKF